MNIPPYDFEPDEETGSQLNTVLMAVASQLLNHVTADTRLLENTMSKLGIDQENSDNMQADLFDHAGDEPEPGKFDPVVGTRMYR